jgi:hypothetical protein
VSDAVFILLVEKDAAFMRLAEDRFYNTYPCIILTAKGQPDVASRSAVAQAVGSSATGPACPPCHSVRGGHFHNDNTAVQQRSTPATEAHAGAVHHQVLACCMQTEHSMPSSAGGGVAGRLRLLHSLKKPARCCNWPPTTCSAACLHVVGACVAVSSVQDTGHGVSVALFLVGSHPPTIPRCMSAGWQPSTRDAGGE